MARLGIRLCRVAGMAASLALSGLALAQSAPGGTPPAARPPKGASGTSAVIGIETTGAATRGWSGGSRGAGGAAGPEGTSFGSGGNEAGSARSLDTPPVRSPVKGAGAP